MFFTFARGANLTPLARERAEKKALARARRLLSAVS